MGTKFCFGGTLGSYLRRGISSPPCLLDLSFPGAYLLQGTPMVTLPPQGMGLGPPLQNRFEDKRWRVTVRLNRSLQPGEAIGT